MWQSCDPGTVLTMLTRYNDRVESCMTHSIVMPAAVGVEDDLMHQQTIEPAVFSPVYLRSGAPIPLVLFLSPLMQYGGGTKSFVVDTSHTRSMPFQYALNLRVIVIVILIIVQKFYYSLQK